MTLYDRLGGAAGVDAAVRELSARIRVHTLLGPFFDDLDYDQIVEHRADYLVAIFGGPEAYEGRGMRESHRHLGLRDEHMDAFLHLVRETLTDLDVSPLDIEQTVVELERLRPVLVVPQSSAD
ncbi:group I truncated hemoglobin [Microcella alkaliphila]|uniref:Protozoan/cyanobacterial globin family protein n=1 Tax=Microcella alkaliphila TaxID=279828 RepID=A0A0U5B5Z2_9MICO|nr:group 1 truncated hemoglobin [Microcella alkaliphila]BAU31337.1 protozoan/cyanobacterial globin family protein [Microcella alkaliphila]